MKTKITTLFFIFLGLTVILSVGFIGAVAAEEKLESELIVRTEAHQELAMKLEQEFEKLHPETDVIITEMGSSTSYKKSFAEMPNPQADILTTKKYYFILGLSESQKKYGFPMFEKYISPERNRLIPSLIDEEGYYQTERWGARAIVYHIAAEEKHGSIDSLDDLLTWKGTYEYADPITTGAGFAALQTMIQNYPKDQSGTKQQIWDRGYKEPIGGIEFAAKLEKAHSEMAHPGTSAMGQQFSRQDLDAMWNFDIWYYMGRLNKGLKIKAVYPKEGTIISANDVGILHNAQHPKAARAWIDFVLSKRIQSMITENTFYRTAAKDVELPAAMKEIAIANPERINMKINEAYIATRTKEYKELWEQHVLK